ncbi:MAG TPA: tyrosine-type recombinase/integrase [Candidatus Sulfotelmatobacter sp.]|nr:tyrosine-type recombinase/integrase [Candidatus Sulfotelmatobacter sp.]
MAYQNGSLKKVWRVKQGKKCRMWLLRFRVRKDGRRVENGTILGSLIEYPTKEDAWKEVDRLGIRAFINKDAGTEVIMTRVLTEYMNKVHGLEYDLSIRSWETVKDSRRAKTTTDSTKSYVKNHIMPQWGNRAADSITKRDLRDWLYLLRDDGELAGPTISKIKTMIGTIYNWAQFEGLVTTNPATGWRLEDVGSDYVPVIVEPEQVKEIIALLPNPMHQMLVLVCASTAIRASEACGLKWRDINWDRNQIKIERRWTAACIDKPKTKASKAPVAMSPQLAWFLHEWRRNTPYAQDEDWVFPSFKMRGSVPMCAGIFVTDHLRPAALAAGIQIVEGQRFGLHSLRSSMATWMVSIDKTDVKTAQGNMRHAGPEIMLSKYAQVVTVEMRDVQVRWFESCGLGVGQHLLAQNAGSDAIQ